MWRFSACVRQGTPLPLGLITMLSSDMTAKPKRAPRAGAREPGNVRRWRARRRAESGAGVVPDGFYKDMVWNLRNGVVAITRDGRVAVMNEIAYRVLGLKPRADDIGRHFTEVLKEVPDVVADRRRRVRAVAPAQPRRAAAQAHRQGDRLHALARQGCARTRRRRDALLQGLDARRAARGARAPARPAGRARRDGGGDRARGQEPARRHRGDGRAAQAAARRARPTRRPSSPTSSRKRRWPT